MPLAGALRNPSAPSSRPAPLPLNKIHRLLSPLDATLLRPLASAHSKRLTKSATPLSATLTKNPAGTPALLLTNSPHLLPLNYLPTHRPDLPSSSFTSSNSFLFTSFADPSFYLLSFHIFPKNTGEGGTTAFFCSSRSTDHESRATGCALPTLHYPLCTLLHGSRTTYFSTEKQECTHSRWIPATSSWA